MLQLEEAIKICVLLLGTIMIHKYELFVTALRDIINGTHALCFKTTLVFKFSQLLIISGLKLPTPSV